VWDVLGVIYVGNVDVDPVGIGEQSQAFFDLGTCQTPRRKVVIADGDRQIGKQRRLKSFWIGLSILIGDVNRPDERRPEDTGGFPGSGRFFLCRLGDIRRGDGFDLPFHALIVGRCKKRQRASQSCESGEF
jgi:hypothetical protein